MRRASFFFGKIQELKKTVSSLVLPCQLWLIPGNQGTKVRHLLWEFLRLLLLDNAWFLIT